jgi:hypothetical protein
MPRGQRQVRRARICRETHLLDGGPTIRNDDGGRGGAATVALVSAGLS